jgi:ribosomal protein S18 acetylase RimI-like enzyme
MSAAEQSVELVETTDIEMFLPVMKEIDFGDRFLLSMLHWCGIGRRSSAYWKVFLLLSAGQVVGVSGLYREPGMPEAVCWVGWVGIRPRFRRQGFGTRAMYLLWDFARSIASQELWVCAGSLDDIAVRFYKSPGFEVLGTAAQWAHGQTMDDSDIILRRMIWSLISSSQNRRGDGNAPQDHYLSILIDEAARTGKRLETSIQVWAA